ncbi:MAG: hypothetical protein CMN76_11380 [Spirochaetaceae bacterium]|nr:hypothetical protein [Spirochaetaceae bacterium]|tara:strand:- start:117730 stop:118071 length:342 start_codon:yes stop_codon:yes gene_type:complete
MHKESNQPFRITKITVTTILFAALAILVGLAATRFAFYVVRLFDPFGRNGDATGHLLTILYILILIAPLVWIVRSNYRSQFSILLYVLIQLIAHLNPYTFFFLFACGFYRNCL